MEQNEGGKLHKASQDRPILTFPFLPPQLLLLPAPSQARVLSDLSALKHELRAKRGDKREKHFWLAAAIGAQWCYMCLF